MTTNYQQAQPPVASHCPDCGASEASPELFCTTCRHLKGSAPDIKAATFLQRLVAHLLDIVLVPLTLFIGYLVWWLIVLSYGQTPGKQLVGIRSVRADGQPLGWGMTFVREFLVKGLMIGFLTAITGGIVYAVNYLLPLFDRDSQTLHDKIVATVVVSNARLALHSGTAPVATTRGD